MTKTHQMTGTPTYNSWRQMMRRCYDPKHPPYKNYGGRGLTVCKRWHVFENFQEDMGLRPIGPDGRLYSIHRPNNDDGYHPGNGVWADDVTQARETRNIHPIEYDGVTRPISEWGEIVGQKPQTILMRLRYGWSPGQALGFEPQPRNGGTRGVPDIGRSVPARGPRATRSITWRGVTRTVVEWSEVTGYSAATIYSRVSYGWDPEKIFTTPVGAIRPKRGQGVGTKKP